MGCERTEEAGGHNKCRKCLVSWVDKGDGWRPITCVDNQSKGTPYRHVLDVPDYGLMRVED
jgi:hypothetical protein